MKKMPLLVGIGLAIVAALYVWFHVPDGQTTSEKLFATKKAVATKVLQHASPRSEISSASKHSGLGRPTGPFSHLPQSRLGLPLEADPFVAESIEEQKWLDRNGYPNAEQWVAYSSAPDGLLAQAAAEGDVIAAVILDSRALARGDKDAANRLLKAGQNGSSFALSMLQAYMAGSPRGNPILSYSLSRVLEMKGDTRAGLARDFSSATTKISPEQRIKAESDALRLFEQLKQTSKKQPFVDKRPFPQTP